jgi:hypothetical protein
MRQDLTIKIGLGLGLFAFAAACSGAYYAASSWIDLLASLNFGVVGFMVGITAGDLKLFQGARRSSRPKDPPASLSDTRILRANAETLVLSVADAIEVPIDEEIV